VLNKYLLGFSGELLALGIFVTVKIDRVMLLVCSDQRNNNDGCVKPYSRTFIDDYGVVNHESTLAARVSTSQCCQVLSL
jgi:hypothetical protein